MRNNIPQTQQQAPYAERFLNNALNIFDSSKQEEYTKLEELKNYPLNVVGGTMIGVAEIAAGGVGTALGVTCYTIGGIWSFFIGETEDSDIGGNLRLTGSDLAYNGGVKLMAKGAVLTGKSLLSIVTTPATCAYHKIRGKNLSDLHVVHGELEAREATNDVENIEIQNLQPNPVATWRNHRNTRRVAIELPEEVVSVADDTTPPLHTIPRATTRTNFSENLPTAEAATIPSQPAITENNESQILQAIPIPQERTTRQPNNRIVPTANIVMPVHATPTNDRNWN